jgi:pimeloyl-ACP methyl ester carboxylesterase
MRSYWLAFPWLLGGGGAAVAESSCRLTPFREALHREGALRDIEIDGRRYCVVEMGHGPAVVLLHGLGGSIYDWRHILRPLARSHRVLAIDLLGSGESEIPEKEDFSIAAQARRVRGILDSLGVAKASLVGNSYGGGVALRLAQDWPERVGRLVLINSVCYPEDIPFYVTLAKAPCAECVAEALPLGRMTRWVLRNSYRTVERLSEAELDTYVQELRAPGRRGAIIRIIRDLLPPDTTEFEARLRTLRAPTLLLWGIADQTIPVRLGRRLVRELPDAELIEIDAGHVPNQERPEEVLSQILRFLD